MQLVLVFVPTSLGDDPYGYRSGAQEYLLSIGGRTSFDFKVRIDWNGSLLADTATLRQAATDAVLAKRVGDELRQFLGPDAWSQTKAKIVEATRSQQPVELVICSVAAELHRLPWELLTLDNTGQHVGELANVFVRYANPDIQTSGPASVPARVLFAWSAAGGNVPSARQGQTLTTACSEAAIPMDTLADTSTGRLRDGFARADAEGRPISALHILCHGAERDGLYGLTFGGANDNPVYVSPAQVRQLLTPYVAHLRLVTLCACDSSNAGAYESLCSLAQTLHRIGIPWVVGSRYPLSKRGAVLFFDTFYGHLLIDGATVPVAFRAAQSHLMARDDGTRRDWMSLLLYANPNQAAQLDTSPRPRIFVSSSHSNQLYAEGLAKRLRETEMDPWLGSWNSSAGTLWRASIDHALTQCTTCIVLLGKRSIGPWEHPEMESIAADRLGDGTKLLLVLLPGTSSDSRQHLPPFLADAPWAEYQAILDDPTLLHQLPAAENRSQRTEALQLKARITCPYPGLLAFRQIDADRFFGREELVERLINSLRTSRCRFLAIVGASGTGKSSLVRAGLLPALRAGGLPDSTNWPLVVMRPGRDPVESLAVALKNHPVAREAISSPMALMKEQVADRRTLHVTTRMVLHGQPSTRRLALIVDQFEELFTLSRDSDGVEVRRRAFLENLLYASSVSDGQTMVLLTMRADLYGECGRHAELADALSNHHRLVRPMSREELERAIERPAQMAGVTLEPGLTELLTAKMTDQAGALPLMQHALAQLWNRRVDNRLTIAAYREMGGVEGALEQHAEAVFAALDDEQKQICQRIMLRLTHRGAGAAPTRRRAALTELPGGEAALQVLKELADARLLTIDDEHVELSHESLILGWSRLRGWLDENGHLLRMLHSLSDAASKWHERRAHGEAQDYLYRGSQLVAIEEWCSAHGEELTERVQEFVSASLAWRDRLEREREDRQMRELTMAKELAEQQSLRAEEQHKLAEEQRLRLEQQQQHAHEQRRRRRWLIALGFLIVCLVALAISIFLIGKARQAQRKVQMEKRAAVDMRNATRMASAIQSATPDRSDPTLVLALIREMEDADSLPMRWREYARGAITQNIAHTVLDHSSVVFSAAFSPDGHYLVTATRSGDVLLWSADGTGTPRSLGTHKAPVFSAEFAKDNNRVVTASSDETAIVWNLDNRDPIVLREHRDYVFNAAFSPDGTRVVTASRDGTARIWPLNQKNDAPTVLDKHTDAVHSARFNPHGDKIVTASEDGTVLIWNIPNAGESPDKPLELTGHIGIVYSAKFSHDGKRIVTASEDTTAKVWSITDQPKLINILSHSDHVRSAEFNSKGTRVLTASEDRTVTLWNLDDISAPVLFEGHSGQVHSARFSPDDSMIATASEDTNVRLWATDGRNMPTFIGGHDAHIRAVGYSPNGQYILTASQNIVRVWRTGDTRTPISQLEHGGEVLSAAFGPNNTHIVTASKDREVRVWRIDGTGKPLVFSGHGEAVLSAVFSRDGNRIVSASYDRTARIWDVDGNQSLVFAGHTDIVASASFNRDGTRIVTASHDHTARVWDATNPVEYRVFEDHEDRVVSAAFSPDGQFIVTGSADNTARVWNVDSIGKPVVLRGHNAVLTAGSPGGQGAFSPGGDRIVTISKDGTLRLWNSDGHGAHAVLRIPKLYANAVAFSPDGEQIITASHRILDKGTGRTDYRAAIWKTFDPFKGTGERSLWKATSYCPPPSLRVELLGIKKPLANEQFKNCRARIDRLRRDK